MYWIFWIIILWTLTACDKKDTNEIRKGLPEMLIYDSVITITAADHGFFNFKPPLETGTNWKSPYDYFNGTFHSRFEIKDYPSQQPFMLSLCIWADIEGNWERWKETCTQQVPVAGKGVFTAHSVPSTWWVMNDPVDFSRADDFDHLGLVVWCQNYKNLSDWTPPSGSCWEEKDQFLPLTLRLTVVAVASDHVFSGWEKFIN